MLSIICVQGGDDSGHTCSLSTSILLLQGVAGASLDHSEAIMDAGCLCADIAVQLERKTHGLESMSFHISNLNPGHAGGA